MLALVIGLANSTLLASVALADNYPNSPVSQVTPGALCTTPTSYRYAEHIAYCERDVSTMLKEGIIADYDRRFGFRIQNMPRTEFKIDHFIPLCMGGANEISNLWPQHQSVYVITDPLEEAICAKMNNGRIKQQQAVELIKQAKMNLNQAPAILRQVRSM
ncbi:MAG: HNH endonuclease [Proteobacteria bacterium]|nr:MAG: HNH endonuclease [Pseudomonadota bacterium]